MSWLWRERLKLVAKLVVIMVAFAAFLALVCAPSDRLMDERRAHCDHLKATAVHSDVVWVEPFCYVNGVKSMPPGQ